MTLGEALVSIWEQALAGKKSVIGLEGESYRVTTTRAKKLRTVKFNFGSYQIDGIEQNPETTSRWAALARQGNQVMQFRSMGRYIGVVCEGKLVRYPAWRALKLPD